MFERLETNTNGFSGNITKDDVIEALSATDTTALKALITAGLDWNYQVCDCNNNECLRQTLLQCLVIPKNYKVMQKLGELHPHSPVNLTLTTNPFGHSIAYCLVKRNDTKLLHALIKDSSDVKINIIEKHSGTNLLELLVEKSEWQLIIELLLINLNSKHPHFIPITKTINKCKDDILAIINQSNQIVQDQKKLNTTKPAFMNKFEDDTKDSEHKQIPQITAPLASEQSVNEVKLLDQLFKDKITYTLTTQEKSVILRLQDDLRKHAKSMVTLRNMFKQLAHCEINGSDNSIEIKVKNMQILDSFLHAKFLMITDIFNPKAEVGPVTGFSDSLVQDGQTSKVRSKNKSRPNKTAPIKQMIEERQTQRQQAKDREKQQRQASRSSKKIAQQNLTNTEPVEDGVKEQKKDLNNNNNNNNYRIGMFSNEPVLPSYTEVPNTEATALEYYAESRIFGYMVRRK